MPLFQRTIFKEFVQKQDQNAIQKAFEIYKNHFQNPDIQDNIQKSKEEQYQEGFLKDLFVNVLDYTLFPQENHNLITELKNPNDAKKADAGIILNDKTLAIIELKDTRTRVLKMIEAQAFGYKNQHPNCKYVITSNFQFLRFYLDNAYEFEDFDLFNLTFQEFGFLYTILHKNNLESGLPIELKKQSIKKEEELTLAFYEDYQGFKDRLFLNIATINKQYSPLILFEKTQKLLDRIIFMCFAQDKGLLPSNLTDLVIQEWERRIEEGDEIQLFDRFKRHFQFINSGFKSRRYDIFGYNGGLFAPDEILDNLQIYDQLLENETKSLSKYNFDTDIDINVLGHIFEHSLNELDERKKELLADLQAIKAGEKPKNHGKRKLDGIFYTPIYITQYMIEETLGKYCTQKKTDLALNLAEIDWDDEENIKEYTEKVQKYETWLKTVTVLDPACGSGAFLNQVLSFFIYEYQWIESIKMGILPKPKPEKKDKKTQTSIFDVPMPLPKPKPQEKNVIHQILENNIFGVDLNSESVSITKLSLWLKTAQMKQKLNDLNENIKVGNSLIDDPKIDEKAFDWKTEFAKIWSAENQGFTLIVGNPPYVDIKTMPNDLVKHFFEKYETAENRINLYSLFIERAYQFLQKDGMLSFIIPNSLLVNSSYLKVRQLIYKNLDRIIKLPDTIFEDANVETIIFRCQKGQTYEQATGYVYDRNVKLEKVELEESDFQVFDKKNWNGKGLTFNIYADNETQGIIKKCHLETENLGDICDFSLGITPYDKYKGHSPELIKNKEYHSSKALDKTYKPLIKGENITRYFISENTEQYLKYGDWLGAKREERFFTEPRIIVRQIVSGKPARIYAGFTDKSLYFTQIGFSLIPNQDFDNLYLLVLLNSNLMNFIHKFKYLDISKQIFQKILIENCKKFPIKPLTLSKQKPFIKKAKKMLELQTKVHQSQHDFLELLQANFDISTISKKLDKWHELDKNQFLKELKKQKITIPMNRQKEFFAFFDDEQKNIKNIYQEIESLENELDKMVYKLYDLSSEEIQIIENGN